MKNKLRNLVKDNKINFVRISKNLANYPMIYPDTKKIEDAQIVIDNISQYINGYTIHKKGKESHTTGYDLTKIAEIKNKVISFEGKNSIWRIPLGRFEGYVLFKLTSILQYQLTIEGQYDSKGSDKIHRRKRNAIFESWYELIKLLDFPPTAYYYNKVKTAIYRISTACLVFHNDYYDYKIESHVKETILTHLVDKLVIKTMGTPLREKNKIILTMSEDWLNLHKGFFIVVKLDDFKDGNKLIPEITINLRNYLLAWDRKLNNGNRIKRDLTDLCNTIGIKTFEAKEFRLRQKLKTTIDSINKIHPEFYHISFNSKKDLVYLWR